MTKKQARAQSLLLIFLIALAPRALAGTFEIITLWYTSVDTGEAYGVEINARAKYIGPVDPGDSNWLIQTSGNSDTSPFALDDWVSPDFVGAGKNGHGIVLNQVIECSRGYAATADWPKPLCSGPFDRWYKGRGAVTIYHQFNPEIDTKVGNAVKVPCQDTSPPPDPPSCLSTNNHTAVLSFDGTGFETRVSSFPLRRLVNGSGKVSYLMPEWATFRVAEDLAGNRHWTTGRVSSDAFRSAKTRGILDDTALLAGEVDSSILVVEWADHPPNSRAIPLPELVYSPTNEIYDAEPVRLMVMADFLEDGSLDRVRILDHRGTLPRAVRQLVAPSLALRYAGAMKHRVVVFAIIELGHVARIEERLVVLPRCCCGSEFCI